MLQQERAQKQQHERVEELQRECASQQAALRKTEEAREKAEQQLREAEGRAASAEEKLAASVKDADGLHRQVCVVCVCVRKRRNEGEEVD